MMKKIFALYFVFLFVGCEKSVVADVVHEEDELVSPNYFETQVLEKEQSVNNAIMASNNNYFAFIFFTDAHWGYNSKNTPSLVSHIIRNTPVDDVFFGGDIITTHFTDKQSAISVGKEFNNAFSFLGNRFYCVFGNHDDNSDEQPGNKALHLSESEIFSFLQSQMTGNSTTSDGHFNFFSDFESSRTRVIGLDTGRYYNEQLYPSFYYGTISFLIDALETTPDNWNIVIISHFWCRMKNKDSASRYYVVPDLIKNILNVIDRFNSREAGKIMYNGQLIEYSFTNASSRIVLCMGGHNHVDHILYTGGNVPIVILSTDSSVIEKGETFARNTITEQCLDIVVLNYDSNTIRLFRVGRGDDRALQIQQ